MNRNRWYRGLYVVGMMVALAVLSLGARPTPSAAQNLYTYDFEQSVKPWAAGTSSLLSLSNSNSRCPFEIGQNMALVTAPNGGGPAYMSATFPIAAGDSIAVDWSAIPQGTCALGSCQPIVYVGASDAPPAAAWQTVSGTLDAWGWYDYHYTAGAAINSDGLTKTNVALGIRSKGLVLGTAVGIDCVHVAIQPNTQ